MAKKDKLIALSALMPEKAFKKNKNLTNEIRCLIHGHEWTTNFNKETELKKPISRRTYCKRCGVYYHIPEYKEK